MSKVFSRVRGLGVVCLSLFVGSSSLLGQVVINEIMYHAVPAIPEQPAKEWIELYNSGVTTVDLNGWRFSKGINFTFTNVSMGAGSYLVVAANKAAFSTNYPGVVNVVGDWTGKLRNNGETLELRDAAGNTVDKVAYSNEGDWGLRRIGEIYPGQPTWWRGWQWTSPANGAGKTMELMNPRMDNNEGQNWAVSVADGGTPGSANSVLTSDIAPIISEVQHYPAVPRSTNTVTITAQVRDESAAGLSVFLAHRVDGAAGFVSDPMFDDGQHGDGLAGDGLYGFVLGPQPDQTVVEFYVISIDAGGHTRKWPGPTDDIGSQNANALYQVDETSYTGSQPIYRVVTKASEWAAWLNLMDAVSNGRYSDATMNGTVIRVDGTGTEVRYCSGIRNRGAGTRSAHPHNMHIDFPADNPLQGVTKLNFNTRMVHSQVAGNFIYSSSGLLNALGAPVQLRINGDNLANSTPSGDVNSFQFGSYYCFEPYDGDWSERHVPQDPGGNIYKGVWYQDGVQLVRGASLNYLGTDLALYRFAYSPTGPWSSSGPYSKDSNVSEDNWGDLVGLTYVLSNAPDASLVTEVSKVANIDQWLGYFAVNSLILNMETTLATGVGDDYSSYCGVNDPRFQLLSHDFDTVLGQGDATPSWTRSIWKASENPVISRLMKHPEVAPRYLEILKRYADTLFATNTLNGLLDRSLGGWVPESYINDMKNAGYRRLTNVLAQIPVNFTVQSTLPLVNGYLRTTVATAALTGTANAITTRSVLVNGVPATYSAWQGTWTAGAINLSPGINRILVQAMNAAGVETVSTNLDIWYDDSTMTSVTGPIAANTTWTAAEGPYQVLSPLEISSGATLAINPGTTVYFGPGASLTVLNGGRLLAEGSLAAPIRFTSAPGSGAAWGGIVINGSGASPETRLVHATFDSNGQRCISVVGGTLYMANCSFGTRNQEYLSLDGSSFLITDCVFPATTAAIDPVHGAGGIKAGGRGIIRNSYFGATSGYHDVLSFSGGNRALNEPILQLYGNVFNGASDDILELNGADAWVEGNIFLHAHRNGSLDTSSAISGGNGPSGTSELSIIGNIFYDCDQVATAKSGNFYTLLNNTIVRSTRAGGTDSASGVINLRDTEPTPSAYGAGMYLEGNIIADAEQLVRNFDAAQSKVTFINNLLPTAWAGLGSGNSTNDARLEHLPRVAETQFRTWQEAQIMREWLSPGPGSPAKGTGPNGTDMGAATLAQASVAGEPAAVTPLTSAQLTVGTVRTGNFIPTAGFPNGSGYTHYKWRLNNGAWSAETPSGTPIVLSGLANGQYFVDVVGKRDSGTYQDDQDLDGVATRSRTWTVNTSLSGLRINEILARNTATLVTNGESPDLVELYNAGSTTITLTGKGLTDDPLTKRKFTFGAGTSLAPGQYLVLFADKGTDPARYLGFGLGQNGGTLLLHDTAASGGALIDSVSFGPQLADLSIGVQPNGTWALCKPSFGGPNLPQPTGDSNLLKINEWLASGSPSMNDDFVELYNPDSLPVGLGGLYLSDAPDGWPARHRIAPLSYIGANNVFAFKADGNTDKGPEHLNFSLSAEFGAIGLFSPALDVIDLLVYGPQSSGISQGRTPNGGSSLGFFGTPTPGSGNPVLPGVTVSRTEYALIPLTNAWRFNTNGVDLGTAWRQPGYIDSGWPLGQALLGVDPTTPFPYPVPVLTPLRITNNGTFTVTFYFRTTFTVPTNLAGFTIDTGIYLDDGAVFYLNGNDMGRIRLPSGALTASALATNQGSEGIRERLVIPASALQEGPNTLAVEVHQTSIGSTDVMFGMSMDAIRTLYVTNLSNVVINEVLADNGSVADTDGVTADWVELYNPTDTAKSLAGYSLSDDVGNPRRWVFPSGVSVGPGGYLLIRCDSSAPASLVNGQILNTGFGLNTKGDAAYLFDPSASLVDNIKFGPQAADFSIGRLPPDGVGWGIALPTPRSANIAAATANPGDVRINEWAASVPDGPDWFELFNPDPQPVSLSGLYLTDKLSNRIKHLIPPLTFIGVSTNGYLKLIADNDTTAGDDHVNFSLDATLGEALGLFPPGTAPAIDTVTFGPQTAGTSEGRLPDGSGPKVTFTNPSPGAANWLPLGSVVISEVLTHTDLPLEDAVELRNISGQTVNIGGWYLSDSARNLRKYRIPDNTFIGPGQFKVFYEYQFNFDPLDPDCFSFSSAKGDEVWLSQTGPDGTLTGYRDLAEFGPQFNGVSFGRYVTSGGTDFTALSRLTFGTDVNRYSPTNQITLFRSGSGAANAYPRVGPVIISEIMYRPPPIGTNDNLQDEFVELHNISGVAIPLYDPQHTTNGWRLGKGVNFKFTTGHSIPAGGFLVVVPFDPADPVATAAFRSKYGSQGTLAGPFSGKLANSGDAIELQAPDAPQTAGGDAGKVPYVSIDRVFYSNLLPWPTNADGSGESLQRLLMTGYGNEPTNWVAATPTVGGSGVTDSDGDGMPDAWEDANGLNKFANDAGLDPDKDGFTNLQEFLAGTDPHQAGSYLRIQQVTRTSQGARITFQAVAGRTYSIVFRDALNSQPWQTLVSIPAGSTTEVISVTDSGSLSGSARFYRLVTPALP